MSLKKIIPYINAENEQAKSVLQRALDYEQNGADELFIYNYSVDEKEREEFLHVMKQVAGSVDLPINIGFIVKRFEDAKKALYTGAATLTVPYRKLKGFDAVKEATKRFGTDKLLLELDVSEENQDDVFYKDGFYEQCKEAGFAGILVKHLDVTKLTVSVISSCDMPVLVRDSLIRNDIETLLSLDNVVGVATNHYERMDIMKIKRMLSENGVPVELPSVTVEFSAMKKNNDGLVPVIVQDYRTSQVLMLAYMNEDAFNETVDSGRMTYYSRSRQERWLKGETSGHFQYVKALYVDCDSDTLLAKVKQVGAACHTGEVSCFFTEILNKKYEDLSPLTVFQDVFSVIMDRKSNPKEGSYTNYLFDKGIDKILKKCGEEAAEIIIAAKNPDKEEVKYEIADFMYHMMVLMAECGLDWSDVVKELAHRR